MEKTFWTHSRQRFFPDSFALLCVLTFLEEKKTRSLIFKNTLSSDENSQFLFNDIFVCQECTETEKHSAPAGKLLEVNDKTIRKYINKKANNKW